MPLNNGVNVVCMSNSLDPDETPSYSASHLDPSCLHMALWLCLATKGFTTAEKGRPEIPIEREHVSKIQ